MSRFTTLLFSALLLLPTTALADVEAGLSAITASSAEQTVEHLASDALEGRGSGEEGGRKAGDWLVSQLRELELQPFGDEGTYFQGFTAQEKQMRNVVATIPGREAGEAIVIGAHYDHLGLGHFPGSLTFGRGKGKVHNGADDNASGTAALLEIARAFASSGVQPRRRVILVWFDGEERGLLGSNHFVREAPADRVTLMINLDMVGRLKGKLSVTGATTGNRLREWLQQANTSVGLDLDIKETMHSNSDHAPFYKKKIPVLVPFTGLHRDYHRPSDDADGVNAEGIAKISRLCYGVAVQAAESGEELIFASARDGTMEMMGEQLKAMFGDELPDLSKLRDLFGGHGEGGEEGDFRRRLGEFFGGGRQVKPRLGIMVDPETREGVGVRSVTPDTVAQAAGLQAGDSIVSFGGQDVNDPGQLRGLLADAEGRVPMIVVRAGQRMELTADFGGEGAEAPKRNDEGRWY